MGDLWYPSAELMVLPAIPEYRNVSLISTDEMNTIRFTDGIPHSVDDMPTILNTLSSTAVSPQVDLVHTI